MTDQAESRPLSRRELRLQEMASAGVTTNDSEYASLDTEGIEAISSVDPELDVEISPFDENGRQRTRREIRALREQAIAELKAQAEESSEAGSGVADAAEMTPQADQEASQNAESESESEVVDLDPSTSEIAAEQGGEASEETEATAEPEPQESETTAEGGPDDTEVTPESAEEEVAASPSEPVSAVKAAGYSFPDIAPLDEGHSVFDDPALRIFGASGSASGSAQNRDFDELITRAVAQEGAASATNTSALILPVMPDTDGISGPLGETGELFVTGSFDLPKSLSETGGHASLQDVLDVEQVDDLSFDEAVTSTGMMAPVSASRAVSARSAQGPIVSEATSDKSKIPVVLIATGGVLVLGAAGLIVWAASSGLFG